MKLLKLRLATPDFRQLVALSQSIAASVGPANEAEPERLAAFILARALQLSDLEAFNAGRRHRRQPRRTRWPERLVQPRRPPSMTVLCPSSGY